MRIAYLCQYFAPEVGAAQARLLEMSREWTRMGHEVKIITCFPNYPTGVIPEEYRGKRFMVEEIEGIKVYRSWVHATPNGNFVAKTLGYLSFTASSILQTLPRIGKIDLLIVSSPPIFPVISGYVFSRVKHIPYIFEVRDLWPAAVVELGALRSKPIIRALEAMEMFCYRHAAKVVGVTDSFARILTERGVDPRKLDTITNGVDTDFFRPDERMNSVRQELGLGDKFVVLYIGTHGISQALSAQLGAAELLRDQKDIQFMFVGEGAEKELLMKQAKEKGLPNVLFLPNQPKRRVPEFYAAADACLVPLRNIRLFDNFIPCKIFEIMGCGRPIVASIRGEAADIIRQGGAGLVAEPEDARGIADAILKLRNEPDLCRKMSGNGRSFALENYSRVSLARRYMGILERLVPGESRVKAEVTRS